MREEEFLSSPYARAGERVRPRVILLPGRQVR